MPSGKRFACAISSDKDWEKAVHAAAAQAASELGGSCDLALIFVTELYQGLKPAALPRLVREALPCRVLVGCCASGVIGGGQEVEMEPAVSIMGMRLPGVKLAPFYLSPGDSRAMKTGAELVEALDLYPNDSPKFLQFCDPMSCDIENVVRLFNEGYPGAPVIGGLASGTALRKPNWLILGAEAYQNGAVGVALSGEVDFEIAVAQGCRPIGEPLTITKAEGNVLHGLGGRPPLEVLREVVAALSPRDQELARHSLFAGLVMNEYRSGFQRGDFLVRNLMGFDADSGALAVGANLRAGQTLQFQLRDAQTSAEDLKAWLERMGKDDAARGAVLVSCCGRGKGLYGESDHDSRMIQSLRGPLPLAGFFANGEIGPVGPKNYLHGYTSSLAVIR